MPILLIDKAKVAEKLQIAISYDPLDYNFFINEAQEFDLKPLVEENFYFELLANKSLPIWAKIIDGGTYVFDTRTYYFQGISTVLAYFSYARFVLSSSAVSTAHGMVVKTTPNSTPLNLEERKNFHYKKKDEANAMMLDVVKYIERNIASYPSWLPIKPSCGVAVKTNSKTKIIQ
jgi:hypothetical protein